MLNEEKIKIMNKLAMYEQGEGKKYLPVSRYYRSDYIGLAMIKNFFLVTIGYCLILAGIAAYFAEYLIDNVHKMNLVSLGVEVILGGLIMKKTSGKVNPGITNMVLREELEKL